MTRLEMGRRQCPIVCDKQSVLTAAGYNWGVGWGVVCSFRCFRMHI